MKLSEQMGTNPGQYVLSSASWDNLRKAVAKLEAELAEARKNVGVITIDGLRIGENTARMWREQLQQVTEERDALVREIELLHKTDGYYCVECGHRLNYDATRKYYCPLCEATRKEIRQDETE